MESNESKQGMQSQSASLCKAGCGFYGSPSSDGYCSVCFKEKLQRRLLLSDVPAASSSSSSSSTSSNSASSSNDPSGQAHQDDVQVLVQTSSSESASDDTSLPEAAQPPEVAMAALVESPLEESSQPPPIGGEVSVPSEPLDLRNKNVEAKEEEEERAKVAEAEGLKKKNKCFVCKKKVGLTGFGCRCGGLFCGLHRYSDTHDCTFDYKEQGQLEIRKNNPKVTFQKVAKI